MKTANPVDVARIELLLADLRLPAIKLMWAKLAEQAYVYFSNRPFGVKRFQTIHHYSADGARGLALLFGIGTEALVWSFRCQGVC